MREIKVNGEIRTVYTEGTDTFHVNGIYCNTITLLFDFGSLQIQQDGPVWHENDMQLHGPVLHENDIQEISGSPLKPGYGWEKFPGMVKLNCGAELPVTYCLNNLESCHIAIMKDQRAQAKAEAVKQPAAAPEAPGAQREPPPPLELSGALLYRIR